MDILEIEIKAYCDDDEKVRREISAIGGIALNKVREEDIYYNHPARDFAQTDEALRVRLVGDRAILTYKGPKLSSRSKARIEEEVVISDIFAMKKVLLHLGFKESGRVVKIREHYRIDDIDISIDEVSGLGIFVELEKKGHQTEEIEKKLFDLADKLGLTKFERRSYLEMLLEKE